MSDGARKWLEAAIPCKLGTVPAVVHVHGSDRKRLAVGTWVRIRERVGAPWQKVLVTRVDGDGYFMADR